MPRSVDGKTWETQEAAWDWPLGLRNSTFSELSYRHRCVHTVSIIILSLND